MTTEQIIIERISSISKKNICIIGNMSDEFYKLISEKFTEEDSIYILNYVKHIKRVENLINQDRYNKINIISFPITNKKFDWYGWQLLQYYHRLQELRVPYQIFSAIFYRGKHLIQYDFGVLPLAIKMVSEGGFLIVYDCSWSLAKSPTMNPEVNSTTAEYYTKEQIEISQMQYLLDVFNDKNLLEQEGISSAKTRVYRKYRVSTSSDSDLYY